MDGLLSNTKVILSLCQPKNQQKMKKILLLLPLAMLLLTGCSKDDEKIEYSETKGYLTNLASAKQGIIGVWQESLDIHVKYNTNGTACMGCPSCALDNDCFKYSILHNNGKYMYRYYTSNGSPIDYEIKRLTKSSFEYIRVLEYENEPGMVLEYKYKRVTE